MSNWHALPKETVLKQLDTDGEGLSPEEVILRRKQYGKNILPDPPAVPVWKIFFRQFLDFLIGILIIAAIISVMLHEWRDAIAIIVIVVLNGCLGFFQELKAEQAMEELKKMMLMESQVVRDGHRTTLDVAELVPGDLIILEAGERVPADLFLLSASDCQVSEAVLTGESAPVRKNPGPLPEDTPLAERSNMLYCGTVLCNGSVTALVAAAGGLTEFGKIAELTGSTPEESSPLQRQTAKLSKKLGLMAAALCVLIVILGILKDFSINSMFMFGIALAVGAIPEGLPAVLTITLALGMRKMLTRKCLVRRLTANETMGATGVICTDKTGTLTKNEMTVTRLVLPDRVFEKKGEAEVEGLGYEPTGSVLIDGLDARDREDVKALMEASILCNHATIEEKEGVWLAIGDPTEAALIVAGMKCNMTIEGLVGNTAALGELSFDSDRKRMSIVWERDGTMTAYIKGAPEMVLDRCGNVLLKGREVPLKDDMRDTLFERNKVLAADGIRVLAVARRVLPGKNTPSKQWEDGLTFLGMVGITAPPRPEAKAAVAAAHSAGIRIAVLTGDNALTAGAVGKAIGLEFDRVMTGTELDDIDENKLYEVLKSKDSLFARVTPAHKMRLAKAFQTMGKICAMTGDGVNDAPALRQADVGIAMGIKGSDVAKGAADVILLDDSFSSLVDGIEEGRRQFSNIKKFIWYMLCSNFGEVIILSAGLFLTGLFAGFLPDSTKEVFVLLPVQILWLNLVTDGATALALGFERPEPGIMKEPPRDPRASLLPWKVVSILSGIGLYKAVLILFAFWYVLKNPVPGKDPLILAQTVALTGMVIFSKINVFNFRSLENPLSTIGFFTNRFLLAAVAATFVIQAAGVYHPLLQGYLGTTAIPFKYWLYLGLLALPLLVIGEVYKFAANRAKT